MQTVRDTDGRRWIRIADHGEQSRVRDPTTGEETTVPSETLTPTSDDAVFEALADRVPAAGRRVAKACHADWQLGLLVALADDGPRPVRKLLAAAGVCESDFLGATTELRAAGVLAETTVAGQRAYELTAAGREGVGALRHAE
ncbi:DUF7346 family protein [Halobacterium salinarum]|uniref:DUF7346 family protein n=1 Tax=Halobacterium salinarum TaxID=2242 RepID=UPI00255640A0|nr:hypothetical protein [Halobacterium salinarum]MDL0127979.1 hypothetical protein [Halobacterium salinarum]